WGSPWRRASGGRVTGCSAPGGRVTGCSAPGGRVTGCSAPGGRRTVPRVHPTLRRGAARGGMALRRDVPRRRRIATGRIDAARRIGTAGRMHLPRPGIDVTMVMVCPRWDRAWPVVPAMASELVGLVVVPYPSVASRRVPDPVHEVHVGPVVPHAGIR